MPEKKLKENFKLLALAVVSLLTLGTVIFNALEGWSYIDSFYFVAMTATTVGYGDLVPTHTLSKLITVAYSLMIIPIILYAFTAIAKFEVERVNRQLHGIEKKQKEHEEEIEKTERKLKSQKESIKEQKEEIEKTEKQIKKQAQINKVQEVEIEGQEKKIKKQEKEIEAVEEIVEEVLIEERENIEEGLKGKKK